MKKRKIYKIGFGLIIVGILLCIFSTIIISFLETSIKNTFNMNNDLFDALQMIGFAIGIIMFGLGIIIDPRSEFIKWNMDRASARGFALFFAICLIGAGIFILVLFIPFCFG